MLLVKTLKLSEIKPDPKNARRHSERNIAAIADSLAEFGQYAPIIVQKSTGRIIAGNGRYEALKKTGAETVEVIEADVNDVEAVRMALADNRTAELAEWDLDTLVDLIGQLDIENEPLPGWTNEELENLFAPVSQNLRDGQELDLGAFHEDEKDKCTCPKCGFTFKA